MKVLVLGGHGMLGHKLCQVLTARFDTYATVRQDKPTVWAPQLADVHYVGGIHAEPFDQLATLIRDLRPSVVVNCLGIVKQVSAANDRLTAIQINALLPHLLAGVCRETTARFIHLSTDCVFSGNKGHYTEDDPSDAIDVYGKTKYLGEVNGPHALTVRTSIIGRELHSVHGLLEWFLSQRGQRIKGYRQAIFSGFPTLSLANLLSSLIADHQDLTGVWHVATAPISKYDLLCLLRDAYNIDIDIQPDDTFRCDRSLDASRFQMETGQTPQPWAKMLSDMLSDPFPYSSLRSVANVDR